MLGIKEEDVFSRRVLLVLLTLFAHVVAVQGHSEEKAVSEVLGICRDIPYGVGPMVNIRILLLFLTGFNVSGF